MIETKDPRPPLDFITTDELFERLVAARKEIGREIGLRKSVYRRWVSNGTLSVEDATAQMFAAFDAYAIMRKLEVARDEFEGRLRADDRALWREVDKLFGDLVVNLDAKTHAAVKAIFAVIARGKGEATE